MNVTIYIYDIGTPTNPGDIIVDDTWAILNDTELWVAVEWTEKNLSAYAYVDDGPHVAGKGDWTYLNNRWSELYSMTQGTIDSNWAIGAIVEGQGLATIAIGAVKGPIGIKTEVQNTGDVDAQNVAWSIAVKGGILGKINKTASGTDTTLAAHTNLPISVPMFIGFGKISIVVKARAANAQEVTATNSAFVLGPLVIGIK